MIRPALEVAVESTSQALTAREAGADRVELCSALDVGGITPSIGAVEALVAAGVPAHVLIRCRPGDFLYTEDELDVMVRDITAIVAAGADGVVLGALRSDGGIDETATQRLVAAAHQGARAITPYITFHRAIDHSADPVRAAAELGRLGVDRVLTSGGRASVAAGLRDGIIEQMTRSAGSVEVMAGGGATVEDVPALVRCRVAAVHFSARGRASPAPSQRLSVPLGPSDGHRAPTSTDPHLVRAMADALDSR
ncbi:copper homeostasis protein CutC [Microbacterium sp. Leaf151]|uniref:copper homeostasis protein CutC n=1 Tax=Microbacterium sp. Leaf151 TaxID=1736276 RepID=UPI0006F587CB|nr:copper homeostasis protein CutC [Microbacterium sp. Leaf151]KQR26398.1 hypothetical protein ASF76_03970 [Microbacterium sp. Leaf151]